MNKVAMVTGGEKGLGKSLVNSLEKKGYTVISTSRDNPFIENLPSDEESVIHQHLDVTSYTSISKIFDWIEKNQLPINLLINNAGLGVFKNIVDISNVDMDRCIDTNIKGTFLCSQAAFKLFEKSGGGRIINIGSIVDDLGIEKNAIYAASKNAVKTMSRTIAEEGKFKKIRSTYICLGAVDTSIWDERSGFNTKDMLNPQLVADFIADISTLDLSLRLDYLALFPEKGLL